MNDIYVVGIYINSLLKNANPLPTRREGIVQILKTGLIGVKKFA